MLGSVGHGLLTFASLGVLHGLSPQKSVQAISIKVEKKKYLLWSKNQGALEKFYEAIKAAREASAVNI